MNFAVHSFEDFRILEGSGLARRPDEKVKVLGHEDVSDHFELKSRAKRVPCLHEVLLEAFGVEKAGATIGARGDEVEIVQAIITARWNHARILTREPVA